MMVINEMYMAKNSTSKDKLQKLKTKEILIAILLEQIKYEPDSLVNEYKFISDAQVPKTRINSIVDEFKKNNSTLELPLLTSKNAFYGLTHLVRTYSDNS